MGSGTHPETSEREEESNSGTMGLAMTVTGRLIRLMATEDLFMLTEMSIPVAGKTTKLMDLEYTSTLMEPSMRESGEPINSTERE